VAEEDLDDLLADLFPAPAVNNNVDGEEGAGVIILD
jgi:hypothetical protein